MKMQRQRSGGGINQPGGGRSGVAKKAISSHRNWLSENVISAAES
jgi:hypothetical protein